MSHSLLIASLGAALSIPLAAVPAEAASSQLVQSTLYRVSLGPDSVAAVGLSVNDANALLTRATTAIDQVDDQLAAADAAYGTARAAVNSLERSIRAGQAGEPQAAKAALAAARATEAGARATRDAIFAGIISATIEPLSNQQKAALTSIRTSAASWDGVPAGYRVAAHDDASFLALRNALATKRIAIKHNEPVPADATAVIQQWLADPATGAAVGAQEANTAAIEAAWATTVPAPPG